MTDIFGFNINLQGWWGWGWRFRYWRYALDIYIYIYMYIYIYIYRSFLYKQLVKDSIQRIRVPFMYVTSLASFTNTDHLRLGMACAFGRYWVTHPTECLGFNGGWAKVLVRLVHGWIIISQRYLLRWNYLSSLWPQWKRSSFPLARNPSVLKKQTTITIRKYYLWYHNIIDLWFLETVRHASTIGMLYLTHCCLVTL